MDRIFDLQLFAGNGAGLVRVSKTILSLTASATAVTSPTTAYGTLGVNDSGLQMTEARDYKAWTFSLLGGGTGYSVSIYGTADPIAYAAWMASFNPQMYANRTQGIPVCPATSWFLLPGPSEQTGTGVTGNPLTATAPILQYSGTLIAVRAVLTASTTPTGSVVVSAEATP